MSLVRDGSSAVLSQPPALEENCTNLCRDFDPGNVLGYGAFGKVIKARRKSDAKMYAIKLIKMKDVSDDFYGRECEILSQLDHPNIVRYYNFWTDDVPLPPQDYYREIKSDSDSSGNDSNSEPSSTEKLNVSTSDSTDDFIEFIDNTPGSLHNLQETLSKLSLQVKIIQMELCSKSLRAAIETDKIYLDKFKIDTYFAQMCNGLYYLHGRNIVHRDLTPENIFLSEHGIIKIGDFGLSKQINNNGAGSFRDLPSGPLSAPCGTLIYRAPEMTAKMKTFNAKVDMYSLGVIYFELNTKPMNRMEIIKIIPINEKRWNLLNILLNNIPHYRKMIMKNLLRKKPARRFSSEQLFNILQREKFLVDVKQYIKHKTKQMLLELPWNLDLFDSSASILEKLIIEIFERHGAIKINLPKFTIPYTEFHNDITKFLTSSGNVVAIPNNSRIPFARYIVSKKIRSLRRYSIEKFYRNDNDIQQLPIETKELCMDCISPLKNDLTNDAEMLYIAQQVCDTISEGNTEEVLFFINHTLMFGLFSERYPGLFSLIEDSLVKSMGIMELCHLLDGEVAEFLKKIWGPFPISSGLNQLLDIVCSEPDRNVSQRCIEQFRKASKDIQELISNVSKFGINLDRIYLSPFLLTYKNSSGIMFKTIKKHQTHEIVIAIGGRFDSIVKMCYQQMEQKLPPFSAVGISFQVENILKIYNNHAKLVVDVIVSSGNKSDGIPIFKVLQERKIKCEMIQHDQVYCARQESPYVLIKLIRKDQIEVFQMKPRSTERNRIICEPHNYHNDFWDMNQLMDFIENDLDSLILK